MLYLAGVWLEGIGTNFLDERLPRPLLFFLQVASLFTSAADYSIDYRAEAWVCEERRWLEMDTRPYFPIDREHKENRFHRALHFYRQHRAALQALERYLVDAHHEQRGDDGLPQGARVGGVRFSSMRRPIPAPGGAVERWSRMPLAEHPQELQRRWYWTPRSIRAERCGGEAPKVEDDD